MGCINEIKKILKILWHCHFKVFQKTNDKFLGTTAKFIYTVCWLFIKQFYVTKHLFYLTGMHEEVIYCRSKYLQEYFKLIGGEDRLNLVGKIKKIMIFLTCSFKEVKHIGEYAEDAEWKPAKNNKFS